jgi:predicted GTPase
MDESVLQNMADSIQKILEMVEDIHSSALIEQALMQKEMRRTQQIQGLQQERQMVTQLQMEGYTKEEAVTYYNRMLKGEKPWLDPK